MDKEKAWIYEVYCDPQRVEKWIRMDTQHAKHRNYDVIGITKILSPEKRRESENFQKISNVIHQAYDAGAKVIISSHFDGFCKSVSEEMQKHTLCQELGIKLEISLDELLDKVSYFERVLFSSRFAGTPLERIGDLYDYYYGLAQQDLSIAEDEPTWEQTQL